MGYSIRTRPLGKNTHAVIGAGRGAVRKSDRQNTTSRIAASNYGLGEDERTGVRLTTPGNVLQRALAGDPRGPLVSAVDRMASDVPLYLLISRDVTPPTSHAAAVLFAPQYGDTSLSSGISDYCPSVGSAMQLASSGEGLLGRFWNAVRPARGARAQPLDAIGAVAAGFDATQPVAALIDALLAEVTRTRVDAKAVGRMSALVVERIQAMITPLLEELGEAGRAQIAKIADRDGVALDVAELEFMANRLIFHGIARHFALQEAPRFPRNSTAGFHLLTESGSIVSSPPLVGDATRTFHYTRMPSRRAKMPAVDSSGGVLGDDIVLGKRCCYGIKTSPVRCLYIISEGQAAQIDSIIGSQLSAMSAASTSIEHITLAKPRV